MPKIIKKCYICTVAFLYFCDNLDKIRAQNDIGTHFEEEIEEEIFYTTKLLLN